MKNYNSSSIEILDGIEGIKKRPEMYIGNTENDQGLNNLLFEIINNSVDEKLINQCNNIIVTLYKNNSISIRDDGRGIPVDIKLDDKKFIKRSALEIVFTELHSGSKFNNENYNFSGGLHGLGISCVNALSKWLKVIIYKNKKINFIKFKEGVLKNKLIEKKNNVYHSKTNVLDETNVNGTEIIFLANKSIFKNIKINKKIIEKKLKELSFLLKDLKIIFIDKIYNKIKIFFSKENLKDFIKYLNKNKKTKEKDIFYINKKYENNIIEIIILFKKKKKNNILCYTNCIFQKQGGSHFDGFKEGLINFFYNYINKKKKLKKKIKIKDIIFEIISIISIKSKNPKFDSQIKNKLISKEIKNLVKECTLSLLNNIKNKNELKKIIKKIIINFENRKNKKNIKEIKKKNFFNKKLKFNKLADCQEINLSKKELYIVEGDSAGGSAKQGRNRKFQAVLPLKGKILNVEKSNYSKLINSEQMIVLINTIGCGIKNDFNIKNLRYKKIIIMTDADVDGLHIRTLLLTFFYRYIPQLIKLGYIYIAQPPLYKIIYKKKEKYFINNKKLEHFLLFNNFKKINFEYINKHKKFSKKKFKKYISLYLKLNKKILKLKKKQKKILKLVINDLEINIENTLEIIKTAFKFKYIKKKKFIKINIIIKIRLKCSIKIKFFKFNFLKNQIIINKKFLKNIKYSFYKKINFKFNNIISNGLILLNKKKKKIFLKFKDIICFLKNKNKSIKKQRYKGLGEMNSNQLWETTMNPKKRGLLKITIKKKENINKILKIFMGKKVIERKKFINKYSLT